MGIVRKFGLLFILTSGSTGRQLYRLSDFKMWPNTYLERRREWVWNIRVNTPVVVVLTVGMYVAVSFKLGCRHSSVDSSTPSILPPRVRVPSTPSMLLSINILFVSCRKDETKQKEAHFETISFTLKLSFLTTS